MILDSIDGEIVLRIRRRAQGPACRRCALRVAGRLARFFLSTTPTCLPSHGSERRQAGAQGSQSKIQRQQFARRGAIDRFSLSQRLRNPEFARCNSFLHSFASFAALRDALKTFTNAQKSPTIATFLYAMQFILLHFASLLRAL